jgi:hypothetical protein
MIGRGPIAIAPVIGGTERRLLSVEMIGRKPRRDGSHFAVMGKREADYQNRQNGCRIDAPRQVETATKTLCRRQRLLPFEGLQILSAMPLPRTWPTSSSAILLCHLTGFQKRHEKSD